MELINIEKEWYKQLLEDLRKLEFTGIVLTKWNQGKRIDQDYEKFGKPEYGSKRIENIAKDLQTSSDDLWACHRFYKKYNKQELLDAVQQFSWRYIWHNLLPNTPRKLLPSPQIPKGKYQIIYADPPWDYYAGGYKNQKQHYDSMSLEEICKLPISELADDNCILFMWVTFPMLDQFVDVLRCWGFEYSTVGFIWVKSNKKSDTPFIGLGNWTRSNAEICVIAKRGQIERLDATVSQIVIAPIEGHSKKPDIVRDKIVQLVGDLPRIELFARSCTEGWTIWGDQI